MGIQGNGFEDTYGCSDVVFVNDNASYNKNNPYNNNNNRIKNVCHKQKLQQALKYSVRQARETTDPNKFEYLVKAMHDKIKEMSNNGYYQGKRWECKAFD